MEMATDANGAMSRYRVTADDVAKFVRVDKNIKLDALDLERLRDYPDGSGVYYWIMRHGDDCFKIYAGRTTSLRRRVGEYANRFQPGVPNDYKMRHFETWMRERFADAQLDLYFYRTDNSLTEETRVVRATGPFINKPVRDVKKAREAAAVLRDANWKYYGDVFDLKCAKPDSETT
jgi:hypothetical protein